MDVPGEDTARAEANPGPPIESDPTTPSPEPLRLWLPRDILIPSAFLGFPGGFGLVARNAWRMGRRSHARLIVLIGAAIAAAYWFLLPDDLPRSVFIGLSVGIAGGLYQFARGQVQAVESTGGRVVRAPARSGIATFLGGWLVTAGPALLLALFLGPRGIPAGTQSGTVLFGTSGSGCEVSGGSAITTGDRMYWVAYLSREAHDGETLRIIQRAPGLPDTPQELVVDGSADCVSNDGYAFALPGETITVDVTIGSERLAYGTLTLGH